jgi:hypothetical protein
MVKVDGKFRFAREEIRRLKVHVSRMSTFADHSALPRGSCVLPSLTVPSPAARSAGPAMWTSEVRQLLQEVTDRSRASAAVAD